MHTITSSEDQFHIAGTKLREVENFFQISRLGEAEFAKPYHIHCFFKRFSQERSENDFPWISGRERVELLEHFYFSGYYKAEYVVSVSMKKLDRAH